eukprot:7414597-Ditylum_brightwellii.AAC.1
MACGEMTINECVAWVSELNKYLMEFPAHNRNQVQPLDKDEIMDILEYGVPAAADKPKDKKSSKPKNTGKRKDDALNKPAGEKNFYRDLHRCNKTHNTKDCYKLKLCTKRAKQGREHKDINKVVYKDLNAFVNAKVTAALKKAKKIFKKEKKDGQVK